MITYKSTCISNLRNLNSFSGSPHPVLFFALKKERGGVLKKVGRGGKVGEGGTCISGHWAKTTQYERTMAAAGWGLARAMLLLLSLWL